jgi:hypothetical protein
VPLEQIRDILGHADPRTTKVISVDVAEELQREAVDKLGFLFSLAVPGKHKSPGHPPE